MRTETKKIIRKIEITAFFVVVAIFAISIKQLMPFDFKKVKVWEK